MHDDVGMKEQTGYALSRHLMKSFQTLDTKMLSPTVMELSNMMLKIGTAGSHSVFRRLRNDDTSLLFIPVLLT